MDETPTETPLPALSGAARRRIAVTALCLVALLFGAWGVWRTWAPEPADARAQIDERDDRLEAQQEVIEELQQRVATLSRSDQISRDANRELQGTLAERDEEIAGRRADVAYYERLVGATAQRRGLSVHALAMQAQSVQERNGSAWHFKSTLTQNLNRGAVSAGRLTLEIEGSNNGKLQTLDWDALRQQQGAEGIEYSFKYFQQIEGDVFLPEGFSPVRVSVHLQPRSGAAVEHSFTWAEATGSTPPATASGSG